MLRTVFWEDNFVTVLQLFRKEVNYKRKEYALGGKSLLLLHCSWCKCRVAAVERLPVHHHSADYISFPLGLFGPLWYI